MNGSINIKDINTWQFNTNHLMWSQNDVKGSAYVIGTQATESLYDKPTTAFAVWGVGSVPIYFCPVIEYKE